MDIENYRKRIDEVDQDIIRLLNERASLAQHIGEIKKSKNLPIYVPEREKAIYEKIERINEGVMPTPLVKHIYKEIISYSRSLEYPLKVAFLGPVGSYTHQAAFNHFGSSFEKVACASVQDVFVEVEKGKADYAVVPIENSYHGPVFATVDSLTDSELKIIGEIYLRIRHNLLSAANSLSEVQKVFGHPQALEQCRAFLESHLPNVPKIQVSSNSKAAEMAAADPSIAAVAGNLAAEIYKLNILSADIEDVSDNTTRFVVLGKEEVGETKESKSSVIFSIANKPGALYDILSAFSKRKLDLSKIESRPSKRKAWDYIFLVDFKGHVKSPLVQEALEEVKDKTLFVKILGSYPLGGSL